MTIYKYSLDDVESIFENPYINGLSKIEYGKMVQCAAEEYLTLKINKSLQKQVLLNENVYNNGAGYDRKISGTNIRIQIKFRQVEGKEPYSRQTHFSNTRRHSKKNKNNGDSTGMIAYNRDEFDYCLVILCHIKNGIRQNYTDWTFSLIPVDALIDKTNNNFLLPNIQSEILKKYHIQDFKSLAHSIDLLTKS